MKEKMTNAITKMTTGKGFIITSVVLSLLFIIFALPVFAAPTENGAKNAVGVLTGYVLKIFQYVGVLLLIWAIAQLVLAFKNEDADSKSRAMMMLLVAVLLCVIKPIAQQVINALGLSNEVSLGTDGNSFI